MAIGDCKADPAQPGPFLAGGHLVAGGAAPGWVAASTTNLGVGRWQLLGRAWDTRPHEHETQPELATALGIAHAPGGLVMRSQYLATASSQQQFSPIGNLSLPLYIAAWDEYPGELLNVWTRPKAAPAIGYDWPYPVDTIGDRLTTWALRKAARCVLDVAPYLAQPGAEIDLSELAGGARYIIAFWRGQNVLRAGADDLAAVRLTIPWELRAGRALRAAHRDRWCLTIATNTQQDSYAGATSDVFDAPAHILAGYSPPIPGQATYRVSNGGALPLIVGCEEWSAGPAQRIAHSWADVADYAAKQPFTQPVGGALNVYAAHGGAPNTPCPALIHLEVTR